MFELRVWAPLANVVEVQIAGGERVGLTGGTMPPRRGQPQVMRLSQALTQVSDEDYAAPDIRGLSAHGRALFVSDFLGDIAPVRDALTAAADRGVQGITEASGSNKPDHRCGPNVDFKSEEREGEHSRQSLGKDSVEVASEGAGPARLESPRWTGLGLFKGVAIEASEDSNGMNGQSQNPGSHSRRGETETHQRHLG